MNETEVRQPTDSSSHELRADIRNERENVARVALDLRRGRALTDTEWASARAKLMEFATILRQWGEKVRTNDGALFEQEAA